MSLILLAILCSTANQLMFSVFLRLRVAALPAIVVNYLVAFGLGCWMGRMELGSGAWPVLNLQLLAALQGGVLAGCFLLMSAVTRRHGVAVAAVSTRLAVVLPVVAAFWLYGDRLRPDKIVAILLALGALVLLRPEDVEGDGGIAARGRLLPLLLFLGFGFNLTYTKLIQARFLTTAAYHPYLTICFLWAFIWGLVALVLGRDRALTRIKGRDVLGGLLLGLTNYGSIFFLISALAQPAAESSVIFPIVSVSVVMLSFLGGVLLFHEAMGGRKVGALSLGVLALILIY